MRRPGGVMLPEQHELVLNKVKGWGAPISLITHAGMGEPLLDPRFEEKIRLNKKVFPAAQIVMYSNGALLNRERAMALIESGLDTFSFSVNALEPETYRRIMKLDRDVTYANIETLLNLAASVRTLPPRVQVSLIRTEHISEEEIVAFTEYWESRVHSVVLPPRINWGGDMPFTQECMEERLPCAFLWNVLMVDWDGTVKRCCEDYDSLFPMGNILEHDPDAIFNSAMMMANRKRQLAGDFTIPNMCRTCVETLPAFAASFWQGKGPVICS
jgi:radical SAM protein with 4Fe4S-binding SPASM domain